MPKQKRKIGSVVKIPLKNGKYGYAQILDKASYVFFNYFTEIEEADLEKILDSEVLFIISAYDDIVTKGRWTILGEASVKEKFSVLPLQFIQDKINPNKFRIYDPNTGEIEPTDKDKVKGLEEAAVWEAWEVEERLQGYCENNSDKTLERYRSVFS